MLLASTSLLKSIKSANKPILFLYCVIKGLIISAKKYLKMPAATEPPEAKTEREELLRQALKEHIMLERQKKKEGNSLLETFVYIIHICKIIIIIKYFRAGS